MSLKYLRRCIRDTVLKAFICLFAQHTYFLASTRGRCMSGIMALGHRLGRTSGSILNPHFILFPFSLFSFLLFPSLFFPVFLVPSYQAFSPIIPDTFQLPLLHKITCKTTRPVILLLSASSAIFPDCLSVCSNKYDAKCPVRLSEWHFISMESREAFTFSFSRHAILCKTQGDFRHRKCKSTER